MSAEPKPKAERDRVLTAIEACDYAADLLLRAGFLLSSQSKVSESRYYRLPNRVVEIRVSQHRQKGSEPWAQSVVASLLFMEHIAAERVERRVDAAIVKYMRDAISL